MTGASRGAGRGIAIELGKAGAIVYVTGRSKRKNTTNQWPGSIDETVSQIESYGGQAIPIQCDHTDDLQTEAVLKRIEAEQGRLDILVNNVWGGHDIMLEPQVKPFWEYPLDFWDAMFTAGVRAQLATNYFAIPLLRKRQSGVIFHTTFWDDYKYLGTFYYDLAKNALVRMAYGLSMDLKEENVAVIAVSPGWMRTELVLMVYQTDEEHWREVKALKQSESPHYIGRAIVALSSDEKVMEKSGQVFRVGDLATEYGFTDLDGRTIPPFTT